MNDERSYGPSGIDELIERLRRGEFYVPHAQKHQSGGQDMITSSGGAGTPHALLDGVTDNDTIAQAPAKGMIVVGNATPKWAGLGVGLDGLRLVARSAQALGMAWETDKRGVNLLIDGGGSAITTGIKGTFCVPFACTVANWRLEGDQSGSATVDVLSAAFGTAPSYASMVGAGTKPNVSGAVASALTAPSGWTATAIAANTTIQVNVVSVATFLRLTVYLELDLT